jgi:hypothetical protein
MTSAVAVTAQLVVSPARQSPDPASRTLVQVEHRLSRSKVASGRALIPLSYEAQIRFLDDAASKSGQEDITVGQTSQLDVRARQGRCPARHRQPKGWAGALAVPPASRPRPYSGSRQLNVGGEAENCTRTILRVDASTPRS